MKRSKLLIIGILAILVTGLCWNPFHTIKMDKKEVKQSLDSVYYGNIKLDLTIKKTDEQNQLLSGVKFQLKSYNDVYSYSSNDSINGGSYLILTNTDENNFEKLKRVFSSSQQTLLINLKTTQDFRKVDNGKNIDCYYGDFPSISYASGDEIQFRVDGGFYCDLYLPTMFTLEESIIPSGYSKEKLIIPGAIMLHYLVPNFDYFPLVDATDEESENVLNPVDMYFGTEDIDIELEGIRVRNLSFASIKYGSTDTSELVGTSFDKAINIWLEKGTRGTICDTIYNPHYSSNSQVLDKVGDSIGLPIWDCYKVEMVNKKGNVKFEATYSVNNEESIIANFDTTLQYKVMVKNIGEIDAIDSVVTAALPKGFVYVEGSASNDGVYKNGTIEWTVPRIDAGKSFPLMYQAYAPKGVDAGQDYVGEATITNESLLETVKANKTNVKLSLYNPKTAAPIGLIGLGMLVIMAVGIVIYKSQKEKN